MTSQQPETNQNNTRSEIIDHYVAEFEKLRFTGTVPETNDTEIEISNDDSEFSWTDNNGIFTSIKIGLTVDNRIGTILKTEQSGDKNSPLKVTFDVFGDDVCFRYTQNNLNSNPVLELIEAKLLFEIPFWAKLFGATEAKFIKKKINALGIPSSIVLHEGTFAADNRLQITTIEQLSSFYSLDLETFIKRLEKPSAEPKKLLNSDIILPSSSNPTAVLKAMRNKNLSFYKKGILLEALVRGLYRQAAINQKLCLNEGLSGSLLIQEVLNGLSTNDLRLTLQSYLNVGMNFIPENRDLLIRIVHSLPNLSYLPNEALISTVQYITSTQLCKRD